MSLQNYKKFTPYFAILPLFRQKNWFQYMNSHIFTTNIFYGCTFAIEILDFTNNENYRNRTFSPFIGRNKRDALTDSRHQRRMDYIENRNKRMTRHFF